jgi:hypothetical protein
MSKKGIEQPPGTTMSQPPSGVTMSQPPPGTTMSQPPPGTTMSQPPPGTNQTIVYNIQTEPEKKDGGFLSSCGRFMVIIYAAIFGTFFPIIFIIIGIVYLSNTGNVVNGSITSTGNSNSNNDGTCRYQKLKVSYTVGGVSYNETPTNDGETSCYYNVGSSVYVYYDTSNPAKCTVHSFNKKNSGIAFIIWGVLLAIFGWGIYFLSKMSKTFTKIFCLYGLIKMT